MAELSVTPSIEVTIGCHSRLYYAFVTSAPTRLDAPSTVTLYAATRSDVARFAADDIALDADPAPTVRTTRARGCHRVQLAARAVP